MSTLRDLVQQGLRESGIIPVGTQPDADIFEETFSKLKTTINRIFGEELGEYIQDIDVNTCVKSEGIPANSRILFTKPETLTLTLPKTPQDGSRFSVVDVSSDFSSHPLTLDGNGRKISGSLTEVLNEESTNKEYFYRADLAEWKELTELTPDSQSPFPTMYDDLLTTMLAIRVNYRYGMESDFTSYGKLLRRFKSQYKQTKEVFSDPGLLYLSSYNNYFTSFNTGSV